MPAHALVAWPAKPLHTHALRDGQAELALMPGHALVAWPTKPLHTCTEGWPG